MPEFEYDEVGYWSEIKLDIVNRYALEYSKIMNNQRFIKRHLYIDAFAGAGRNISKTTGEVIAGSALRALEIQPPFSEFHLIDIKGRKTEELRRIIGDRPDVEIYKKDANEVLLKTVFPRCGWNDFARALCLLDPYSLIVDWKVIETAGRMKTIEIFFNFMIMDVNMNVLRRNPDNVDERQIGRMNKAWGDNSWRDLAYEKQSGLFGDLEYKVDNETLAEAFRKRLQDVAGFAYVPRPIPMRNKSGGIIYYLYFASPNKTGHRIVTHIFDTYRNRGVA